VLQIEPTTSGSRVSEKRLFKSDATMEAQRKPVAFASLLAALMFMIFLLSVPVTAQTPVAQPAAVPMQGAQNLPPSISLSPAVVMAKGNFGQGLTQTLTLTNQTGREFAFEMVAEDVVIKDGKRVFVSAGERQTALRPRLCSRRSWCW